MRLAHLLHRLMTASRFALVVFAALQVAGCSSSEERAKSYYESGMKLLDAHEYAKASIEFKNAVKLKKDYVAAWLALAKIEELNRNFSGEVPYLRTAVELDPKDVSDRLKLARLFVIGGANDDALKLVDEVNTLDEHNADALALKAFILLRAKDVTGALRIANAALDLDPKNAAAISVLATDRLAKGDTQAALQLLDKAEAFSDGKDLGIQLLKLRIYQQTNDWPKAEALLKTLSELHPDGGFRNQLVRLYLFQKRPDDAEKELRAIAGAKPDNPQRELALVRFLSAFRGSTAARQELVARINDRKDNFPYQLALAQFDFAQGKFRDSEQLLKKLIADSSSEDVLKAQVALAQMYLNRKDLDAADSVVSQILQKDNRHTEGLRLRAAIRIERGQVEAAINDLRTALNDQPHSIELMLLLATAYERSGSIELADKQFADAVRVSNFNPGVGLAYVAFLQRRGGDARAEDVLTDLTTRWPQNQQVLAKSAEVRLSHQDWAGAEEIATKIKRFGNAGVADEILGAALVAQNKYEEGLAALQSAYAADPSAVQPMLNLVRAYVRTKQTDKAVALLRNALQTDPTNAEAHVLLGSIQQANNAPDQAIDSYKSAIEKQPKSTLGYQALVGFYIKRNEVDKAQDVIRTGLTQLPDNSVLRLLWASILELKNDYEGAIAEYQSMLDKDPASLVIANNLASLLADHRTDKASLERAQSLAATLRKSPVPQFKDTLGWVSYQNGDYAGAVTLLEEAAAALPNRAMIHYHLGMAYIATNQLAKASEQLNAALNQAPDAELKLKIQAALKKITT